MRWLKNDLWKAGIAITGVLLPLVLMVWVPVSVAGAYQGASGLATPITGTAQATPTEDATVTALNKEKLTQEVAQQRHTLENWLWSSAATILSSFLSMLVVVIGVLFGFWQWRMGSHLSFFDTFVSISRREEICKFPILPMVLLCSEHSFHMFICTNSMVY